ncbi:MAG: hypothetical protein LIP11_10905 [Clostridiales bacterium]|nr:hypothetical protein [Clostridiales bacterium]
MHWKKMSDWKHMVLAGTMAFVLMALPMAMPGSVLTAVAEDATAGAAAEETVSSSAEDQAVAEHETGSSVEPSAVVERDRDIF